MIYVASEIYDNLSLDKLIKLKDVSGIVLGDPYCMKRMFPYGEADLVDYAIRAYEQGLKVIFQTSCYMTERIFDQNITIVKYLHDRQICEDILVQDVGFSVEIKKMIPEINLIWSQISRSRNDAENMLFNKFLKKNGIYGVGLIRPEMAGYLKEAGIVPVYSNRQINYSTVNRECYYIHEMGIWDHNCDRGCLKRSARMVNENRGIDMTIDGYKLNSSYADVDLSSVDMNQEIVLLRGWDVDEIARYMESMRG